METIRRVEILQGEARTNRTLRCMDFPDLLLELGTQFGFSEPLLEDQNGVCEIVVDEKYVLTFEAMPALDRVYVYSVVGTVENDAKEKAILCRSLLEENACTFHEGAGCFSLDVKTGEVVLMKKFVLSRASGGQVFMGIERMLSRLDECSELFPKLFKTRTEYSREQSS
jgi:hypothetical protein